MQGKIGLLTGLNNFLYFTALVDYDWPQSVPYKPISLSPNNIFVPPVTPLSQSYLPLRQMQRNEQRDETPFPAAHSRRPPACHHPHLLETVMITTGQLDSFHVFSVVITT